MVGLAPTVASADDGLTSFQLRLLGLQARPEPESQFVPRNTPTGIHIALGFASSSANVDESELLSLLPNELEIAAELVGPGIGTPIQLRGRPGQLLPIPPLVDRGNYLVRDIRLELSGALLVRAYPDSANIQVIERVIVTQVTTRPLDAEEIRQKGIIFGDDNFKGFEFTLALKLDSRPVNINFPVVFDSNDVLVPTRPSASLDLHGARADMPLVNAQFQPVLLKLTLPDASELEMPDGAPEVSIPGLLVIPGDIGFLNQFFSAMLVVSNAAPLGSGLSVRDLEGTIRLPAGEDEDPGTADDPLVVAKTASGAAFTLPIVGIGADGVLGTGDDSTLLFPAEQGQAEYLLEGRKEGFHQIDFDITGTLEGLPVGPIDITGTARGGVVVRNPYFNVTFSAPRTVRRFEEFTLFVNVTNTSESIANFVNVALNALQLSGAELLSTSTLVIDSLAPGDSETLRFQFRSLKTGEVTASYLNFEQGAGGASEGDLLFTLGVGERGAPLSPDTLVLPTSVEALPLAVVDQALRVLGQAWSLATAPSGTLPDGVLRVPKQVVIDRALEVAEAGLRVQLGERLDSALATLAFTWLSADDPGFDQLLRETRAGEAFQTAIGQQVGTSASITELHEDLTAGLSSRAPHVLVSVGDASLAAPVTWEVRADGGGALRVSGMPGSQDLFSSDLENAGLLPLSDPVDGGRATAVVTAPGSNRYEVRWTATDAGNLDLSISLPRSDGTVSVRVFSGVTLSAGDVGVVRLDLLSRSTPLVMEIDGDGDGLYEQSIEAGAETVFGTGGAQLVSATVIGPETLSGADSFGRAAALLFDRELRPAEADSISNYRVDPHELLSARTQLSGRLVFLFLDQPAGALVERELTVSGLFDATGRPIATQSVALGSRIVPPEAVGGVVNGRVLDAEGSPIEGAQVVYLNTTAGGAALLGIAQQFTGADGRYQFDWVRQADIGAFVIQAVDPATGGFQERSTRIRSQGERLVVDLVMRGRGGVTGTVTDLTGEPVPGARVLVTSDVDPGSWALVDADGAGHYVATDIIVGPVSVKAVSGVSSGLASGSLQRAGTFTTLDVTINTGVGTVVSRVLEIDGSDVTTPVPRARIFYLVPGNGGSELVAGSGDTDEEGLFVFEDVPTGPFRIAAFDLVRGYQASKTGELVVSGTDVTVNGCVDGECQIIFEEEAVGTVTGEVRLASGEPAVGAIVSAGGIQVLTQADGRFVIESVAAGSHAVTAEFSSGRRASATVNLVTGTTVNVSLTLPGVGSVVVTVLDADGTPLAGHTVIRVTSGCAGFPLVTDGSGVAVFEDVPIPGGSFKALRDDDVAVGYGTVRRDGDAASIALRFGGFGTVTGTVIDANGDPVHGADVVLGAKVANAQSCSLQPHTRARQIKTGPEGTFQFDDVPVGAVHVSASSFFLPIPAAASDNLLADGDVKDFTLSLLSNIAGELSGTVYLPDGITPAGSDVLVTIAGGRPDVTVRTDGAGRYSFAKIFPAGRYTVVAADPVTGKVAKEFISLRADQDLTTDLRLLGQADVDVTVLDGGGVPVDDAFVEIRGARYPLFESAGAVTPSDGGGIRFLRVPEGSFSITASDDEGRGGRVFGAVVEDGTDVEVTVSLTVTGTVTGTYKSADGSTPIPNAEVSLRQGTGRFLGSTVTSSQPDELGRFSFDFVPAGNVLVTAMDPLTGRLGETSGIIEAQDQVLDLEILQLGSGTIAGIVTSGGAPIAADVRLISTTGLSSAIPNLRAHATTDASGAFVFDGVPVGNFNLRATVPGLLLVGTADGFIDTDGQVVGDIEIELAPSGTLTGDVLRPDASTGVPAAALTIRPPSGAIRTDSDAGGRYQTAFVPVGFFDIEAREASGPDAGIASGELTADETLEVDVVFNGTGTVQGEARDYDDTLLTTGTVRLTRSAPFARDEWATVASDGSFQFFGVPVGTYNLSLAVPGDVRRGNASGQIEVDGDVDAIVVKLADAGFVTGLVVKEQDGVTPAPNTVIELRGASFMLSVLTGPDGRFDVSGVPLGNFEVWAEDPVTNGLARVPGELLIAGEIVDVGTMVLDTQPIAVESITPAPGSRVAPDTPIVIRFTDATQLASLPGRFFVSSGGANVTGETTLSADGLELTFVPYVGGAAAFSPESSIDVLVRGAIADTFRRRMGKDFHSDFTTGAAVVTGLVKNGSLPADGVDVTLTAADGPRTAVTDLLGGYRFEDVPQGSILVQALAASDGRGSSASRTIGPADGLVTIDFALGYLGSLAGQVFTFDANPAGAGLEVVASNSTGALAVTTTDAEGRYTLSGIPVGLVTVDVIDPLTGDRGRATGSITNASTTTMDVTMQGVGSVRLFVRDGSGNAVTTARAQLSFKFFPVNQNAPVMGTMYNESPESDGSYLFAHVLAGWFEAYASDSLSGLAASGTGTVTAGEEVELDIDLEPAGSVRVTVSSADGSTPVAGASVGLRRWNSVSPLQEMTSDDSGEVLFENAPVSFGPYVVDVRVAGRLEARARDVTVSGGGETHVAVRIAGRGTVSGSVIAPEGESLSGHVTVDLKSLAAEIGGTLSDADATDGTYVIDDVPVGAFTVSGHDLWNKYQGEVAGAITADGESVVIDIPLQDNGIDFSIYGDTFFDGNEFRYRVWQDGRLDSTGRTLFDVSGDVLNLEVSVDGGAPTPFSGLATGAEEEAGRELVTASEDIDGVRVQRKMFVPQDGYFARYLEIFENLGGADVNVTATLRSHLSSASAANGDVSITATSSGDSTLSDGDVWILVDDAKDLDPFDGTTTGAPATAFVLAGEASLAPAALDFAPAGVDATMTSSYDVNVPAGGRAILLHFVSQESFRDSAHAAAERLRRLPPESLAGLDVDELAAVVNFSVPSDGVSDVEALPPLDGNVFGRLLAHDGVTGVGASTGASGLKVRFHSDQILYRRVRVANADGDGRFSFEASLGTTSNLVIPRVGYALDSSRDLAGSTVSASAASDFESRSLVSRAEEVTASATSSFNYATGPENALDGKSNTEWRAATGVTSATLDIVFPSDTDVEVDTVRVVPDDQASLSEVQIDLLGDAGQVLDSRLETFTAPDAALIVAIDPPVSGVHGLSLIFSGDAIRVSELDVYGASATDLGSAVQDLTFTGSAGVRLEAKRASGVGVESSIFGRSVPTGSQVANGTTGVDGVTALLAPLPADIGPIDFTLTATSAAVGHSRLKTTGRATLSSDTTTLLELVFPETASLTGHVTSSTGQPVAGISVSLFYSGGSLPARNTDASGNFGFENLPADTYTLRITRNGRYVYSQPIALSPPAAQVQNLQIPTFGTIDLTVLADAGGAAPAQPISTAVKVVDVLGVRNVTTNASGQKTITNVAGPSLFTLEVSHPADASNITIETGAVASDGAVIPVTVVIPALGSVTGTVFFADESGAALAAVELSGPGVTPRMGTTNASGVYTFGNVEGLLPLTVVARHPGLARGHIFAVASGEVPGNGGAANIDVPLPGTGTVHVSVTEVDGTTPISGASLSIRDSFSSDFRAEGATSGDGTGSIVTVPEGSFTVRAELFGVKIGTAVGEIAAGTIGTSVSVNISPPSEATVEGTVFAADGITPVPSARVRLLSADGTTELMSLSADAVGVYRFAYALPVGDTSIVHAELADDATVSAEAPVTAAAAGETIVADVNLPLRVVSGRVLESDGATSVEGVNVVAFAEGGFGDGTDLTDADGRFTIFVADEGGYELVATDPAGLTGVGQVALDAADVSAEQDISLPPFGVVEGTVLDATGAPPPDVASSEVALHNANLASPRTTLPDGSGFYRFERVAEGAFTVVYDDASTGLSGATTSFLSGGASLGEPVNIARAYGVTVASSSQYSSTFHRLNVIDGDLNTSWFTAKYDAANLGTSPFLELTFPKDATVTEIRLFGDRLYPGYKFLAGRFELFDGDANVSFDSGVVDLPLPNHDVVLEVPETSGVRRVRFTGTDDQNTDSGLAELEVYGELAVTNLSVLPGVSTNVSSSYAGYGPERAIDGNLMTSWFVQWSDAVNWGSSPYYEVLFPDSVVVREIEMFGNRQSANYYDFYSGRFELFDVSGAAVFDSGDVTLPAPDRDVVVPVPDVGGVTRARFTPTADESRTPGFAELVVWGRVDGPEPPAPDITLPGTGSLSGQLLATDGTPRAPSDPSAPVKAIATELESRAGVITQTDVVDETGGYRVTGVAQGDITVNMFDLETGGGGVGIATTTIEAGVETTDVDVHLGTARRLPAALTSDRDPRVPGHLRRVVRGDASVDGEIDSLGNAVAFSAVSVNGKSYPVQSVARSELAGRQLVIGPVRMSGLQHTRKVLVPSGGAFARSLDIFDNPHEFDVEVTVQLHGSLNASDFHTSSGDAVLDQTDRYLAGELDTGTGLGVVYAGAGAVRLPDAAATDGRAYALTWRRLVVPAGGRIILMSFSLQGVTRSDAVARAEAVLNLTDSDATADLTPAEKAAIVNFIIP